ncbi:hypothetical protein PIB30_084030 [Stylosanthes scabra]|uniref:Uncharacterized protein n=1 Tax=Stylosanthes scabra TaxID=79078 RepID=A0ABU6RSM4_9FABA|nr:hypothetical protein [Stylosanthes scabra]
MSTPLESEGKTESVYPIGFSNGVSDRQELEAFCFMAMEVSFKLLQQQLGEEGRGCYSTTHGHGKIHLEFGTNQGALNDEIVTNEGKDSGHAKGKDHAKIDEANNGF